MDKLRIGVFGGGRGKSLMDQIVGHADACISAVCDMSADVLEKVRKKADEYQINVALYSDFEDFIKSDIDAVILANYATEHAEYAIRCMEEGKHVLSEVLPAETLSQMVRLVEAVERTGMTYVYSENYCYRKAPLEMWKKYREGKIGEVQYAEGEYIHDCSSVWHAITYGDKNHWRNRIPPNFYCTHSVGPILAITGLRPVRVVGFETTPNRESKQVEIGYTNGAGVEMVVLENGAVVKSVHGCLKRNPGSYSYQVYGTKGMMESHRYNDENFNLYIEGDELCKGEWQKYNPDNTIGIMTENQKKSAAHDGSDYYSVHCFIEKLLGREDGKWCIDVYTAADMGMCGILGYRSVMSGNAPMTIPDLRNKNERDRYRNDNVCTTPSVAGDSVLPRTSFPFNTTDDSVYDNVRKKWLESVSDQTNKEK